MQHSKKRFMYIVLMLISVLLIFALAACGGNNSDLYYDYGDNSDEGDWQYDEDDAESSFFDEPMTAERAEEIYTVFVNASYEEYREPSDEEATATWESYDAEARTSMYQQFSEIAEALGLSVNSTEAEWIEHMDYYSSGSLFSRALISLDMDNDAYLGYLRSIYSYQKGLNEGKYGPLDATILAVADNLVIEQYIGSNLLCVGGDHNIEQVTYEWTMQEESFAAGGSVTAVKTDDIFTDEKVSYFINGQKGIFETVEFGSTDLLPVFKGIGAIDTNGAFLTKQVDICAVNLFDAEILYILSQDEAGITIAVVVFDESQGKYVWDEQIYTAIERCCFTKDNEFCYLDAEGELWNLTQAYEGVG